MRRRLFHAWQLWLLEWNFLKKQMGSFIKIMANFVTKNETKPTYKKSGAQHLAGLVSLVYPPCFVDQMG